MSVSIPDNEGPSEAQELVVNGDERLFRTGEYTDLKVICGGREWNLHRNILASRCEWFDKALCGNFKEAHTQEIFIHEFSPADIQLLLEYIYTGAVDFEQKKGESALIDICIRFYDLADFFQFPKLQEYCNQYLVQDIDNIGDILYDLRAAYGKKTLAGDVFRGLMKTFVHETRYRFFRSQQFIELLEEIPELAADMLISMIRSGEFMRISYPVVCSSCATRKSDKEHHSHTMISSMSRAYTLCRSCVVDKKLAPSTEDWDGRWSDWEREKASQHKI
ncbi:hypothetical protein PG997_006918 [Apiospora hydei]|uniref:BTB domain-containing protein n=1 Tax=Apiospora hydei TaxID=1337664 RepID=A0ABR1WQ99_9PEZI